MVNSCLGLNTYLQWLAFSYCFPYYCVRFSWCVFQWFFNGLHGSHDLLARILCPLLFQAYCLVSNQSEYILVWAQCSKSYWTWDFQACKCTVTPYDFVGTLQKSSDMFHQLVANFECCYLFLIVYNLPKFSRT